MVIVESGLCGFVYFVSPIVGQLLCIHFFFSEPLLATALRATSTTSYSTACVCYFAILCPMTSIFLQTPPTIVRPFISLSSLKASVLLQGVVVSTTVTVCFNAGFKLANDPVFVYHHPSKSGHILRRKHSNGQHGNYTFYAFDGRPDVRTRPRRPDATRNGPVASGARDRRGIGLDVEKG